MPGTCTQRGIRKQSVWDLGSQIGGGAETYIRWQSLHLPALHTFKTVCKYSSKFDMWIFNIENQQSCYIGSCYSCSLLKISEVWTAMCIYTTWWIVDIRLQHKHWFMSQMYTIWSQAEWLACLWGFNFAPMLTRSSNELFTSNMGPSIPQRLLGIFLLESNTCITLLSLMLLNLFFSR